MAHPILDTLAQSLGADRVLTDAETLDSRRFDRWALSHLRDWLGQAPDRPLAVVRPRTPEEVQRTLAACNAAGVAVMPWGLGSGVCGGVLARPDALILDLSAMNRVRGIDEVNLLASFDAGKNGLEAEEAVAARGLTIGHWPQSIALSSVGGWVSTRASGQFSTAYGNIEDMVHSLEVVTPQGELITLGKAPRAAAGPDLRHIFMGAEGVMGVVTGVTLALRRQPERQAFTTFFAAGMAEGIEAQRRIMQAEWRPPVMRLYDAPEVKRLFREFDPGGQAMLIMVHEGPAARVEAELAAVRAIAADAGMTEGPEEAARAWLARRNHVPSWTELFERGFVVDTVEVSASWTQIGRIYDRAVASLSEVEGLVNASAHSSHAYQTGLNLYFSFAVALEDASRREAAYLDCWRRVMEATAAEGGGIAHHHGAGRLRKPYLHHDLGQGGVSLLRRVKQALDPNGVMNPGNLLPDA